MPRTFTEAELDLVRCYLDDEYIGITGLAHALACSEREVRRHAQQLGLLPRVRRSVNLSETGERYACFHCENAPAYARGLCRACYQYGRYHGRYPPLKSP